MKREIRHWTSAIAVGMLLLGSSGAQAASFDCAKAKSEIEQRICGNPKLAQLDEALAESYKIALQDKTTAVQLKKEQRHQLGR